jgi:conjugal transfer pilus assembly protein TraF
MTRKLIITGLVLLWIVNPAWAEDYYSDSQHGWWWYERDKPLEEKKESPEKEKTFPKKEEKTYPSLSVYPEERLWDMDPEEFEKVFVEFRAKAIRWPTEVNVTEYYKVSEIARRKALAFTNTSELVWQIHPELSTIADYPTNTPGMQAKYGMEKGEQERVLQENRDDFALVMFVRPGCQYCEEERKILKWFTSSTGWVVKEVDISQQPDLANRFGVTITPTLILIQKGNREYMPVSAGVAAANEIEEKTYRTVRYLKKEITPEEYSLYEFQRGGSYDVNPH